MKVLLFQAPLGRHDRPVFPYGICCVATAIKQQHEVRVFDPNVESDYPGKVRELIASFQPEVIGVSLRNVDTTSVEDPWLYYLPFTRFLKELRIISPGVPIITGGSGFSIFPEKLMELCPEIDFGVYLEAEESFPELLGNLTDAASVKGVFVRQNGQVKYTGERRQVEVAKLPIVDRSFLDIGKYSRMPFDVGVETKRGCMLNCAYCCYPHLNGHGVRLRSPGQVVDEIEELVTRYKLKNFAFIDSVLDVPKEHYLAILREMIRRRLKVEWSGWFSGREFDEEMFFLSVEAGCKIFSFSPDAFTAKALRGLNKYIRHEDILRIYDIFKKHAVSTDTKVSFNFFANSPESGLADVLQTLAFCVKAKLVLRGRLNSRGTGYIRIMPFTALYETALKKKLLAPETNMLPDNTDSFKKLFYHEPHSATIDLIFTIIQGLQRLKGLLAGNSRARKGEIGHEK